MQQRACKATSKARMCLRILLKSSWTRTSKVMFVLWKEGEEWETGGGEKENEKLLFLRALPLCVFSPETHILWGNHMLLQGMVPYIQRGEHAHKHTHTHTHRWILKTSHMLPELPDTCCSLVLLVKETVAFVLFGALSLLRHTCSEMCHPADKHTNMLSGYRVQQRACDLKLSFQRLSRTILLQMRASA